MIAQLHESEIKQHHNLNHSQTTQLGDHRLPYDTGKTF